MFRMWFPSRSTPAQGSYVYSISGVGHYVLAPRRLGDIEDRGQFALLSDQLTGLRELTRVAGVHTPV